MEKRYTIGVMIGNANSPHTMDLMQGIFHAAHSMNVNVIFFLGIHSSYYYKSYFGEDVEDDYDYQFNAAYDYQAFADLDALVIAYGSLCIFLDENESAVFLEKYRDKPRVLLEERDKTGTSTSIIADNYNGMYTIAEHLVRDHGYRNFTYLAGPHGNTDARERRQAVYDVMKKYGIPFESDRIAYGDYSSCVQKQVNQLLDTYPDMDAMICANDVMEETAYRECSKRGKTVGKDIAITGFDDWELAETMNPPLTTVLQNAFDMGYMAIIGAVELCKEKKCRSVVVPAEVRIRESCGCAVERKSYEETSILGEEVHWTNIVESYLDSMLKEILPDNSNRDLKKAARDYLRFILKVDFRIPESQENIKRGLQKLFVSELSGTISPHSLLKVLDQFVDECIQMELKKEKPDREIVQNLLLRKRLLNDKIVAYNIKSEKEHFSTFQQESWFVPLISKDMLCHMNNEQEMYRCALVKLNALNAKASYLYIFKEPIAHYRDEEWKCPDKMYLAAYQMGEEIISYKEGERPEVSTVYAGNGRIVCRKKEDQNYVATILCLFSGEMQYGILVAEINPANLALFYLISRQIGNMLRMYQMSKEQRRMQQKLEALVREVREKNEVLNFLSESDALTGSLNRRGFMEKAVQMNRENAGKEMLILFADLDHLKEINDSFGHIEGDFAIRRCAETLKSAVGENGVTGRIGGDEFCAMIPGNEDDGQRIREQIRRESNEFNCDSDKPYYVELSVGYHVVRCGSELVISDVLKDADKALYEEKKKRRKSVKKHFEQKK